MLYTAMPQETDVPRGTTLTVYRVVVKAGSPVGVREVQRALGLSSPSVAAYHLSKLQEAGLIREESDGYVADKIILKNLIRFRRALLPKSIFVVVFIASSLVLMLTIFRPEQNNSSYLFSLAVIIALLIISTNDTLSNLRSGSI